MYIHIHTSIRHFIQVDYKVDKSHLPNLAVRGRKMNSSARYSVNLTEHFIIQIITGIRYSHKMLISESI